MARRSPRRARRSRASARAHRGLIPQTSSEATAARAADPALLAASSRGSPCLVVRFTSTSLTVVVRCRVRHQHRRNRVLLNRWGRLPGHNCSERRDVRGRLGYLQGELRRPGPDARQLSDRVRSFRCAHRGGHRERRHRRRCSPPQARQRGPAEQWPGRQPLPRPTKPPLRPCSLPPAVPPPWRNARRYRSRRRRPASQCDRPENGAKGVRGKGELVHGLDSCRTSLRSQPESPRLSANREMHKLRQLVGAMRRTGLESPAAPSAAASAPSAAA